MIPWGVILYTAAGGLKATFMASYLHTGIIFIVLVTCVYTVYVKSYSSDLIYDGLHTVSSYLAAKPSSAHKGFLLSPCQCHCDVDAATALLIVPIT